MKQPQWITAGIALALAVTLFLVTQGRIFGPKQKNNPKSNVGAQVENHVISFDTILAHAKESLLPGQITRLNFLEKSISRGDVQSQQVHVYHQLADFWRDSVRVFEPYAWYTAQSARLVNSEKSLTFAAHLFLNSLKAEANPELKNWKALQAKDLFERSLKVNPANDSSEVGLGAVYIYSEISSPMEGIQKLRKVAETHPENVFAQTTLGYASVMSGQLDKAVERFEKVLQLQPKNLEAILALADVHERREDKANAIVYYRKSLPLIEITEMRNEVEQRIAELSKK